jgi:hypothetical protein
MTAGAEHVPRGRRLRERVHFTVTVHEATERTEDTEPDLIPDS